MVLKKLYRKKLYKKRSQQYKGKSKKYGIKKSFGPSSNVSLGMAQKQYATLTETYQPTDLNVNTTYNQSFALYQFKRANEVAANFRFYRAKRVVWKYEPLFNLYTDGGVDSLPYLYAVMNRTQDNFGESANQLRQMGAVPQVFNSTKTIAYKPNWCAQGLGTYTQVGGPGNPITSINGTGLRKCYDWLECPRLGGQDSTQTITPNVSIGAAGVTAMANYTSSVLYNGHNVRFDQVLAQGTADICRLTVTVEWEFKGPKVDNTIPESI